MALLSIRELSDFHESEYLRQEEIRAYATGSTDQFRDDAECVRENLYGNNSTLDTSYKAVELDNCYPNGNFFVCKHFDDNPLFRDEFNRKFNLVIDYHRTLWRDTPFYERNRAHYSFRYYKFFEDLMFLFEQYPDACSNDEYNAIVRAREFYRAKFYREDKSDAQWRKWPIRLSHNRHRIR